MALCPKDTWQIPDGYIESDSRTTYGYTYCSNIDLGMPGSDIGKHNMHIKGGYRNITASKNGASVNIGLFSSLTDKIYSVADKYCNYTKAIVFPALSPLYSVNTQSSLALPKRAMYPAYIDFSTMKYREILMGYKQVCNSVNQPLSYLFKSFLVDTSASLFQKRIYRNDKMWLDTTSYQFKDIETNQVVRNSAPDIDIFRPFTDGSYSTSAVRNHRRELHNFKYFGTYFQLLQYNFDNDLYEAHRQEIEEKLKKDTKYNIKKVNRIFKFEFDSEDIVYQKLLLSKSTLLGYEWDDDLTCNFIDGKYRIDFENKRFINVDTLESYTDVLHPPHIIFSFLDYKDVNYSKYLKYLINSADFFRVKEVLKALENNTSLYNAQNPFYYFNLGGVDRVGNYFTSFYKIDGWYDKKLNHYWQKDKPSTYPDGINIPEYTYTQTELDNMFSYPCYIPPYDVNSTDKLSTNFYKELNDNPDRFQRVISEELLDYNINCVFSTWIDRLENPKDQGDFPVPFIQKHINDFDKTPLGSLANFFTTDYLNKREFTFSDWFTPYYLIRYANVNEFTGSDVVYARDMYSSNPNYTPASIHPFPPNYYNNWDMAALIPYIPITGLGSLIQLGNQEYDILRIKSNNISFYNPDTRFLSINYNGLSRDNNVYDYPKRKIWSSSIFNPNIAKEFVDGLKDESYYNSAVDIQRVAYSISPLHCNIENLKKDVTDAYEVYHYFHLDQEKLEKLNRYDDSYSLPFIHIVYIKGVTNSFTVPYRETSVTYLKDFLPDDVNEEDYAGDVYTDINGKKYTIKNDMNDKEEYTAPKVDASVNITSQVLFNFQRKYQAIWNMDFLLEQFRNFYSQGDYLVAEYEDSVDGKIKYEIVEGNTDRWYRSSYKLDRCTPYLWVHNTYHTVQAFRFNTIDPLTSWWSWIVPKAGPRLNLLGQPKASREMLGGYYNSYDKPQNLYLQKCYGIYTRQWDKIKNPNYTDSAYNIDNRKGRVLPKFTNKKLLTYTKPMLTEINKKADNNESDYESYVNSIKTQFGTCITTRFTFTIYFNARIRATKLLARMGWMYLDYIYTNCKPDEVDEGGNYYTSLYAPDRIQFAEKRVSLRFRKEVFDKTKEGNLASYYCELNKANTELTFYCRVKQIKYILQVKSFCPRFNQDYKNYDLNNTIQVTTRIPNRHLEPIKYTHKLVARTNPPKTKYSITNKKNTYSYDVSAIYYNTPMTVEYEAMDDTKQEVEFTPKPEDVFTCFYTPYGRITNTDETYKEFIQDITNFNVSRSIRKYLRDRVFIRYSNSMIEDTYFKLFNKTITIRYDELNPFDLDGNIDKLYIQPNSSTIDIEETLKVSDSYTRKVNLFHFPKKEFIDAEGTKHSYFDRSTIGWLSNSHLSKDYIGQNTVNGIYYRNNINYSDYYVDYNNPNDGMPNVLGLRNDWSDEQNRNHLIANLQYFNEYYTIFANNMIILLEKDTPDYMKSRQDLLKVLYSYDVVAMQQFDVKATLEKYKDLAVDKKTDIPILEVDRASNTYNRNSAINEITAYIEGVLPNNYVLLITEFEKLFVKPAPDFILTKIFTDEQLYRLGQYCFLVTNNTEVRRLDEGVNISYYRIRLIDSQVIKQMFNMKSGSDYIMAYPFLPMPVKVFKKFPIYCKLFVRSMNSYFENLTFVPYPHRDGTSMGWQLGLAILDIIAVLIISIVLIVLAVYSGGATIPVAIALICLAVSIAILQIVMLFVDSQTAKELGVVVKVLQIVSTVVSLGAGEGSIGSASSTGLSAIQIANITLSSISLALNIINTTLDMVYENKQNKKIEELNKTREKYNNKIEEYVNFIESTEFTGMYSINTTEYSIIEKQIDKFDDIDTFFDSTTEYPLEALYEQLDSLYDEVTR